MLNEDISLEEEFTEQELVFNSNDLDTVDSGVNFSYFRFTVANTNYDGSSAVKKFDVCYSVDAKYIEINTSEEIELRSPRHCAYFISSPKFLNLFIRFRGLVCGT